MSFYDPSNQIESFMATIYDKINWDIEMNDGRIS